MDNKINWYHLDLFAEMYSGAFLEKLADQIRDLGCNGILLELADRVRYESVPDFAAPDALTREQIRAFCDGIRNRGMIVVPLLQHLGHLNHLLKHKTYARLREDSSTPYSICPLHPETATVLRAILRETLNVVGDVPYVHLGGDETHHLGHCDKCAEFVKEQSKSALYIHHYAPLCEMVLREGQRPILWHDMVAAYPQGLNDLPGKTIFMEWNYSRSDSHASECIAWHPRDRLLTAAKFEKFEPTDWRDTFRSYALHGDGTVNPYYPTDFLLDKGFDVILGSACRCWGDSYWFPDNAGHYPNLADTARHARDSKVLGQCVTDWSVRQAPPGTRMLGIVIGLLGLADGLDVDSAAERFASECCGLPDSAGPKLLQASLFLSRQPPFSRPSMTDNTEFQPRDLIQDMKDVNVAEERARLPELRDGYEQASSVLSDMLSEASQPGAEWLAQWLLAADALLLRVDIAEAALDYREAGLDPDRAKKLLRNTDALEKRTRELLEPICSRESLEEHMVVRFAGDRQFLKKV